MPNDVAVRSFICSTFRSVWSLELVRLLHADPGRSFARADLVEILRASDLVIHQSVDALMAVGLVTIGDDQTVRLHVPDAEVEALLKASIELFGHSPDKVRRLIVARSTPGVAAFADAFRLRKD